MFEVFSVLPVSFFTCLGSFEILFYGFHPEKLISQAWVPYYRPMKEILWPTFLCCMCEGKPPTIVQKEEVAGYLFS